MPFLIVVGTAIFAVVMVHAADWAATKVLWLAFALLILGGLGLVGYHRRRMAEIHMREAESMGGWRPVHHMLPWPRECRSCGQQAHTWRQLVKHNDPETSVCAAFLDRGGPPTPDRASAVGPGAGRGGGSGAIDTLREGDDDAG